MSRDDYERLRDLDRRHSWHPFTQMKVWMREEPLIVARGEGNYLVDIEGRRYLDGVSSLWCNVHGHRRGELDEALRAQIDRIAHSTTLGLANIPATELAAELVAIAPAGLSRVFYSDSGAEAVEVAIRMAAQYWQFKGEPRRLKFLALEGSYHGDTIGAVSVGYSELFHGHIRPLLFSVAKTSPPHILRFYRGMAADEAVAEALGLAEKLIRQSGEELAALVIEPMMQAAAGMWNHSAEYLRRISTMAREAGALVIADEVATGFGRTGTMFACAQAQLLPDIMCLGKGLTGGYLPMAATLVREEIYEAFLGEPQENRAFYYGHTYTGNPLAAAVAQANLRLFRDESVLARIQPRIQQLALGLGEQFAPLAHVAEVRQTGLMVGIELMREPRNKQHYTTSEQVGAKVARAARKRGVVIRPLGDVIVLMPPLSISESEVDFLLEVTRQSIEEVTGA